MWRGAVGDRTTDLLIFEDLLLSPDPQSAAKRPDWPGTSVKSRQEFMNL